jgi:hypothetical protein
MLVACGSSPTVDSKSTADERAAPKASIELSLDDGVHLTSSGPANYEVYEPPAAQEMAPRFSFTVEDTSGQYVTVSITNPTASAKPGSCELSDPRTTDPSCQVDLRLAGRDFIGVSGSISLEWARERFTIRLAALAIATEAEKISRKLEGTISGSWELVCFARSNAAGSTDAATADASSVHWQSDPDNLSQFCAVTAATLATALGQ